MQGMSRDEVKSEFKKIYFKTVNAKGQKGKENLLLKII